MRVISKLFKIQQDLVSRSLSCSHCIGDGEHAVAAEWGTTVSNDAEGGLVGSVSAAIQQVIAIMTEM